MVPPLWKTDQQFLKRITELVRDPENTLPRIIQRIKTYFHKKKSKYMFTAELFIHSSIIQNNQGKMT